MIKQFNYFADTSDEEKKVNRTDLELQFPVRCLDRLLAVFRLFSSLTLPSKRSQTLRKNGVGIVVAGIHPISIHGAEILDLELEERLRKEL